MTSDLDGFGGLQRLLRRDPDLALPQQLLGEVRDVTAGDGDVLDAAADDITFRLEKTCGGELARSNAVPGREEATLTTGMTCVTPSPLSITVPVSVRSPTCRDVQEAASARTACRQTQRAGVNRRAPTSGRRGAASRRPPSFRPERRCRDPGR